MATTKITNKMALIAASHYIDPDQMYEVDADTFISGADIIEKLEHMIAQLEKKNASPKKLTAQQEKNEAFKAEIVEFLSKNPDTGFTVSDILKAVPMCEGDSNQHVSALMRALVQAGIVENYTNKRRTYFKIAA